jgi:hypothetical protein
MANAQGVRKSENHNDTGEHLNNAIDGRQHWLDPDFLKHTELWALGRLLRFFFAYRRRCLRSVINDERFVLRSLEVLASIARDQLNSDHQRIPDGADAVWPDDVLDIRLDRVVIADIDGVAGFQHMLDHRAVVTVTND